MSRLAVSVPLDNTCKSGVQQFTWWPALSLLMCSSLAPSVLSGDGPSVYVSVRWSHSCAICQQGRGMAEETWCVFIVFDQNSEWGWLQCLWNCIVTEQWSRLLTPLTPLIFSFGSITAWCWGDEVRRGHISRAYILTAVSEHPCMWEELCESFTNSECWLLKSAQVCMFLLRGDKISSSWCMKSRIFLCCCCFLSVGVKCFAR